MKHIVTPLLTLFFFVSLADAQVAHNIWSAPVTQGLAAQVENNIITFEQVRGEMAPLIPRVEQESHSQEEFDKKMSQLYIETLQAMIDKFIIVKEFNEKKYQFPDSLIQNEYDRILIEQFNNDRAQFRKHLDALGLNTREFITNLRNDFIVGGMRSNLRKNLSEISPKRIQDYYDEHQEQFFQEEAIHMRLIMLKPIGDESQDLMRQQVENVLSELKSGKDFSDVAKAYSQDSRRSKGGDWGWITRKDLSQSLADTAFSLNIGDYSQPITAGSQTYIVYVEDRRAEGIQPLEDVRDQIENTIAEDQSRLAQQAWIQRLRQKAYIKYY